MAIEKLTIDKKLLEDLETVFNLKASNSAPNPEALEQEVLFVSIDLARNNVRDTSIDSRITGRLLLFGQSEKIPLTYFEECIRNAPASITRRFHFSDMTGNNNTLVNLAERSASFLYFYNGQYDPDRGIIESINIECGGDT